MIKHLQFTITESAKSSWNKSWFSNYSTFISNK